jgi:hypothetical protein
MVYISAGGDIDIDAEYREEEPAESLLSLVAIK